MADHEGNRGTNLMFSLKIGNNWQCIKSMLFAPTFRPRHKFRFHIGNSMFWIHKSNYISLDLVRTWRLKTAIRLTGMPLWDGVCFRLVCNCIHRDVVSEIWNFITSTDSWNWVAKIFKFIVNILEYLFYKRDGSYLRVIFFGLSGRYCRSLGYKVWIVNLLVFLAR